MAALCILFVFLTAPVAAHAIARGGHAAGIRLWKGSAADQYAEDEPATVEPAEVDGGRKADHAIS